MLLFTKPLCACLPPLQLPPGVPADDEQGGLPGMLRPLDLEEAEEVLGVEVRPVPGCAREVRAVGCARGVGFRVVGYAKVCQGCRVCQGVPGVWGMPGCGV